MLIDAVAYAVVRGELLRVFIVAASWRVMSGRAI